MEELGLVTLCVLKAGAKGQVQRCNPRATGQNVCLLLSPFYTAPSKLPRSLPAHVPFACVQLHSSQGGVLAQGTPENVN